MQVGKQHCTPRTYFWRKGKDQLVEARARWNRGKRTRLGMARKGKVWGARSSCACSFRTHTVQCQAARAAIRKGRRVVPGVLAREVQATLGRVRLLSMSQARARPTTSKSVMTFQFPKSVFCLGRRTFNIVLGRGGSLLAPHEDRGCGSSQCICSRDERPWRPLLSRTATGV
jgi:hypothetical protein